MENKLQELTEKLYAEGIDKANQEADEIRRKAEEEADEIKKQAKKEAESIVQDAKKASWGNQKKSGIRIKAFYESGSYCIKAKDQQPDNGQSNRQTGRRNFF